MFLKNEYGNKAGHGRAQGGPIAQMHPAALIAPLACSKVKPQVSLGHQMAARDSYGAHRLVLWPVRYPP
jgi:hypothetical protein